MTSVMGRYAVIFGCGMVTACGLDVGDQSAGPESSERPGQVAQAVAPDYEIPVAAAIELDTIVPGENILVIFTCDADGKLRSTVRSGTGQMPPFWYPPLNWGTGCRGVPSLTRHASPDGDALALYVRWDDNHLWQLYWPDPGANISGENHSWADVSVDSGFGSIAGSPVVAYNAPAQETSLGIAVRKKTTNELYTIDWNGGWTPHKVLASGINTAIRTTHVVNARHISTGSAYLSGRGLSSTDTTTDWTAIRNPALSLSYKRVPAQDITDADSTLFPLSHQFDFLDVKIGRWGNELWSQNIGTGAWFLYSSCVVSGSPRSTTEQPFENNHRAFVRGTTNSSVVQSLMAIYNDSCIFRGGTLTSAPSAVEFGERYKNDAVYKGSNHRLYYYDRVADTHATVGGFTLAATPSW